MLFNSISFAIFLPIVFSLYWLIPSEKRTFQNILLLISSYVFYGWWDYRFLLLLVFSTCLDYYSGLKIDGAKDKRTKKTWLFISVFINVGFLGFFKYYNFFADNFITAINSLGFKADIWTIKLILPVGISFYTFHGLSYVFDVYNKKTRPRKDFIDYALFVGFFPLLVAGPIERATHLLPQIEQKRTFRYSTAVDGLKQMLWGFFKKMAIADTCAVVVNLIFNGSNHYSGSTLVVGIVLFAFQIYGDFSGYSDIAIGTARLFGFELLRNFAYPYFSRDIAEFWRRWHISLTSWFKDYLYIPLGGSKGNALVKIRNTFIVFLVSGFWHGANWTFICWGLLNAVYFLPLLLMGKNRDNIEIVAKGCIFPAFTDVIKIVSTFCLTCFAWIFFRSATIGQAISYIKTIFSPSVFNKPEIVPVRAFTLIGILILIEWAGREQLYPIKITGAKWPGILRWTFYVGIVFLILYFGRQQVPFIYFKF
jgi:alginate O-acetyltransferase complex protein AlgI